MIKKRQPLTIKKEKPSKYKPPEIGRGLQTELYNVDLPEQISILWSLGNTIAQIQATLNIPKHVWNLWMINNFNGLKDFMLGLRKEYIVDKAEENLEVMLNSKKDVIKADLTKFTLSTLGKERGYTTRTEVDQRSLNAEMSKDEVDDLLKSLKEKSVR